VRIVPPENDETSPESGFSFPRMRLAFRAMPDTLASWSALPRVRALPDGGASTAIRPREKTKERKREGRLYTHIMIPVDLAHADRLERALKTGADLARLYDSTVTYVGVTGVQPSKVAHNPEEFAEKLSHFAQEQAASYGIRAEAKPITAHDPAIEIDHMLIDAAHEVGADLIVAGTHDPHLFDWPSHGGKLANHADISVLLVRGK
jgi:nucleotide-binding universal stress UspA family protein